MTLLLPTLAFLVGAAALVAAFAFGAWCQRRRARLRSMEPPVNGEWHFHDGHIAATYANNPDDAIRDLIDWSASLCAWRRATSPISTKDGGR